MWRNVGFDCEFGHSLSQGRSESIRNTIETMVRMMMVMMAVLLMMTFFNKHCRKAIEN
jgi:hypothetical protein